MEEVVLGGRDGPCSKQAIRSILVKGLLVRCHAIEWDFGLVGVGIWGGLVGTVEELGLQCFGGLGEDGVGGRFGGLGG